MIPEYLELYLTLDLDGSRITEKYYKHNSRIVVLASIYGYIKDTFGLRMIDGYFYITKNRTGRGTRKKASLSTKHRISKQKDIFEFLNDIDNMSFIYNGIENIFQVDIYKDRFFIDIATITQGGHDEEQTE